jgi:hypothetical protein
MPVRIETAIEMAASPALVWSVLMDFDAYFEWNPFVLQIRGPAVPGKHLLVSLRPPGRARIMSFKPRVLKVVDEREFRWLGRLIVPRLFDGEHYFRLEPIGTTGVRLIHGEVFSGFLVVLAKGSLLNSTRRGFDEMNSALKRRVESLSENVRRDSSDVVEVARSTQRLSEWPSHQ